MSTIETSTGRRASPVRVTHEPLTYEAASPHSYVRDMVLAKYRGDKNAEKRLDRHASEMRVELPKLQRRLPSTVEYRVNPSTKDGQGGEFAPPLWVIERFATAPRPRRVLSAVLPSFPLPDGVSEIKLPRLTTGTETGTPADNAGVPIRDVITATAESQVTTVEGASDWSIQTFEQSPTGAHLDWAIMKDLNEGADAKLEEKLFLGNGAGREITGILKLPTGAGAVSKVEYTSASPKGFELETAAGKTAAQLGDARSAPPELWLMRTARWAWLGTSTDEQKRPLTPPHGVAPAPVDYALDDRSTGPVGSLLGWPVYPADALPANLGTTANQDTIVAIRPSDQMLFESQPRLMIDEESLSGSMGVRLRLFRYAAVLWRQPTGIATLGGTGLVVQNEY